MNGIEIRDLTAELLDDYVYFMEHDAFDGNPDWVGCFCLEGHHTEPSPDEYDIAGRREEVTELIRSGSHTGLLAYEGDRVVGWCHAEPLAMMQNPDYRLGRSDEALARIGGIVCFNLAASHRHQGLPGVLLRHAVKRFVEQGMQTAEAFPWKEPSPRPGRNYLGTVNLYELHGFQRIRDVDDAVLMRRDLRPEGGP